MEPFNYFSSLSNQSYLGNTVQAYVIFTCIFVLLLSLSAIIKKLLQRGLTQLSKKTGTLFNDHVLKVIASVRFPSYAYLSFYIASGVIVFPAEIHHIFTSLFLVLAGYHVIYAAEILIDFFTTHELRKHESDEFAISIISLLIKWALWVAGLLIVVSSLGINVTSIVAGLGIGGIAIALASQNVIGDLISYFAIQFDRPFAIGDFITMGEVSGRVERIGIKTTRVRAPGGEEVVISNREITSKLILNYKKREERRTEVNLKITSDTSSKSLKTLQEKIKTVLEKIEDLTFSRATISGFLDGGLAFQIVYRIKTKNDYYYLEKNQEVILALKDLFKKEKVEVSFWK